MNLRLKKAVILTSMLCVSSYSVYTYALLSCFDRYFSKGIINFEHINIEFDNTNLNFIEKIFLPIKKNINIKNVKFNNNLYLSNNYFFIKEINLGWSFFINNIYFKFIDNAVINFTPMDSDGKKNIFLCEFLSKDDKRLGIINYKQSLILSKSTEDYINNIERIFYSDSKIDCKNHDTMQNEGFITHLSTNISKINTNKYQFNIISVFNNYNNPDNSLEVNVTYDKKKEYMGIDFNKFNFRNSNFNFNINGSGNFFPPLFFKGEYFITIDNFKCFLDNIVNSNLLELSSSFCNKNQTLENCATHIKEKLYYYILDLSNKTDSYSLTLKITGDQRMNIIIGEKYLLNIIEDIKSYKTDKKNQ